MQVLVEYSTVDIRNAPTSQETSSRLLVAHLAPTKQMKMKIRLGWRKFPRTTPYIQQVLVLMLMLMLMLVPLPMLDKQYK
jgi:hypothetical protein